MKRNTLITCLIGLVFLFTMAFGAAPVLAAGLSDINGHWAQSRITDMADKGIISGYPDGTFQPDENVTRAEFISMVNRAFAFSNTAAINYSDVQAADWFAPEIAKAAAAGYISGYPDGTMEPNSDISRQEVAAIIARILKLDTAGNTELTFKDAEDIPAWSQNAVAAMAKAGCISGYPDGTFKAENAISRAEAAVILSRSMTGKATAYDQAGTYGPETGTTTIDGDVAITAADTILQNTVITGNLLIAESVGDGNVTLKNVTVKGTTTVKGGGSHSVVVDNSNLGNVVVNKSKGDVRIVVTGTTTVVQVTLASGAILEESNLTGNGFAGVEISADGAVTLNGSFGNVTIEGSNPDVTLTNGNIANLTIANSAAGTTLDIDSKAAVTTLTTNAVTDITGSGSIITANYNVNGVTTTIEPTHENTAAGVTAPEPAAPPMGGGGGGGGAGGDTTPPSITNVAADYLTINKDNATTYTVDADSNNPGDAIGDVTITFSEAIKKTGPNDIVLRVYNTLGVLTSNNESTIKGMLFNKFSQQVPNNELIATISSNYVLLYDAMQIYTGSAVGSIQVDVFDLSNNKTTITLNINPPIN